MRTSTIYLTLLTVLSGTADAADGVLLTVHRLRDGNSATEPSSFSSLVQVHSDLTTGLQDVTVTGPNDMTLMSGDAGLAVSGIAPYSTERVVAFSGSDVFMRALGENTDEEPYPDGTYRATATSPALDLTTTLSGDYPDFPSVLSPSAGARLPTSFTIDLGIPSSVTATQTKILIAESRDGEFVFPPRFTRNEAGAVTSVVVPEGVLDPRKSYFLVCTLMDGVKGSGTVIPFTTQVEGGLLDSAVASESVYSKGQQSSSFQRKGKLPEVSSTVLDDEALNVTVEVGRLAPLTLSLADVKKGKLVVKKPDHSQITYLKLDFKHGKFKVKGKVGDKDKLGTVNDVRITIE